MRHNGIILCWLALASLSISFKVSRSTDITYAFAKESKLCITGTTNINSFSCLSQELFSGLRATVCRNDEDQDISFKNTILNVNVNLLDCGNRKMNKDLCRALQSGKYPYITIGLSGIKASGKAFNHSGWNTFQADVTISIAGISQPAVILFHAKRLSKEQFQLAGQHTILLSSFGVKPPTAALGTVKVRDAVTIRFDLLVLMHVIS